MMTAADYAFSEKMSRIALDLKLREIATRKLAKQAETGCHCPEFYWKPEAPKLQWIYPFESRASAEGILYEQLQMHYCAYFLQSRLFALLEVFELPLPTSQTDLCRGVVSSVAALGNFCRASDLELFESVLEAGSCTVVFPYVEAAQARVQTWTRRNHVVRTFLKSMMRRVDIVRLSLATGLNALPSEKWYSLGERHFLLLGDPLQVQTNWIVANVFEANSADFDKV